VFNSQENETQSSTGRGGHVAGLILPWQILVPD